MKNSFPLPSYLYQIVRLSICLLLFCIQNNSLNAQVENSAKKNTPTITISGFVKDKDSGEELIGAAIYIEEIQSGTVTNVYGFYSLTLPKRNYHLKCNYLGYDVFRKEIKGDKDLEFDIELSEKNMQLDEVVIKGEKNDQNIRSTEMGTVKLSVKQLDKVPVLFGEKDILKTIQLLPGVSGAGEGNSGFYVRGGSMDQNLILLDEAPVYNASHLMGFFSVFNSDAIKDVKLYKGGMPSQYGGRLSSVLDIKMNNGNLKKWKVNGGIGLISSRLTVEGPIKKNKGSFIIAGRRTYADQFLKLSSDTLLNNNKLYFYDLNAKFNYKITKKDRLYLSGYFGRDIFSFQDLFGINWGNKTGTFRWNHVFGKKLFLNTSAIYSEYDNEVNITFGTENISIGSGIKDYNFKQDFMYYPNSKNTIRAGWNSIYHTFDPGTFVVESDTSSTKFNIKYKYGLENAAYIGNEQKIGALLTLNYGIRYSQFIDLGPQEVFGFNEQGLVSDTTNYGQNDIIKNYGGFEPRFSASYILSETSSMKASYARNYQYLHFLSNSGAGTPLDLWVPSSTIVQPQVSDQVSLGYFKNFKQNTFETSAEIYYKTMDNLIEYKNGAQVILNPYMEGELVFGSGTAYGLELFLKKKHGKFNGWVGYTLGASKRLFQDVNQGLEYPAKQDRTHDFSLVLMYDINERINVSGTWVYNTGDAVTFPSGKYEYEGQTYSMFTEKNGYRMPSYHRMDLGVTLYGKKQKFIQSSWNFSVYNAYGRSNAYSISFRESKTNADQMEAVQTSLFRFVPSITYNFKF